MKYTVTFSPEAARYLRRADRPTQERIASKVDALCANPFERRTSKPLHGRGNLRSARVGDLRLIVYVDEAESRISVERIAPRGQVYRGH